jgi:hypothetical protein
MFTFSASCRTRSHEATFRESPPVEKAKMIVCLTCGTGLPSSGRGRTRGYCSPGCRRAAEYEIRRLQRAIESTESVIRQHEDEAVNVALDHPQPYPGPVARLGYLRDTELPRLETRLRVLLAGGAKVEPK